MPRFLCTLLLICLSVLGDYATVSHSQLKCKSKLKGVPVHPDDVEQIRFALNLEFLETDWFLYGALGYGLDKIEPALAMGGPPAVGTKKANLDKVTRAIIEEFGYQEVGHLRYD